MLETQVEVKPRGRVLLDNEKPRAPRRIVSEGLRSVLW